MNKKEIKQKAQDEIMHMVANALLSFQENNEEHPCKEEIENEIKNKQIGWLNSLDMKRHGIINNWAKERKNGMQNIDFYTLIHTENVQSKIKEIKKVFEDKERNLRSGYQILERFLSLLNEEEKVTKEEAKNTLTEMLTYIGRNQNRIGHPATVRIIQLKDIIRKIYNLN